MAQDRVGSYRLLNMIRAGSTCEVWEVMNDVKGERLALKLLSGQHARNKDEIAFLKHECQVARGMDHPNVIKIHDVGADAGYVYMAMELFATPNLKQLILQGIEPLLPLAPTIIHTAGEGLAYFHSLGWVHRDIKPDNFLVDKTGKAKLIDFALAVKKKGGFGRLFSVKTKIQGTRSYMSPEQIRGQALDQRADLYSFGCMIYELLGGKPPFTGSTTNELLNKHLRSAIPPLQGANRNVSDAFAQLVKSMLAKNPAERPDSMADFLREMHGISIFKVPPAGMK
ncbi:MAG: serine/threonine-protein kinase [Pirellulales bacterium]